MYVMKYFSYLWLYFESAGLSFSLSDLLKSKDKKIEIKAVCRA